MRTEPRRLPRLVVGGLGLLTLIFVMSGTNVFAQDAPVGGIEELKDERERVAREAALSVSEIDIHTATVDEVTAALDEIAAFVEIQQARLEDASGQYELSLIHI